VFYILHGEEEFARSKALAGLRAQLAEGDEAMAQLNTTVFDGKRLDMGDLRHACDTVPFLYERRLVIVHGLLSWLSQTRGSKGAGAQQDEPPASRRAFLEELAGYLPRLPETTRLVFVEEEALKASNPILKLAQEQHKTGKAHIKEYKQPKEGQLFNWVQEEARDRGGNISWDACRKMVELAGDDLRQLELEIEKLLLYAGDRQVTTADVKSLTSRTREADVFELVDCVGRRQVDEALRQLHQLLDENEPPLRLLAMLARQIRILIQVSELRAQRMSQSQIAKQLKLHPYVVKKGAAQALNFTMDQLERAHSLVVDTDWKIKTGAMEDVLALDMLVVALARL
jgi:DNA polymerase-3 subunit delta